MFEDKLAVALHQIELLGVDKENEAKRFEKQARALAALQAALEDHKGQIATLRQTVVQKQGELARYQREVDDLDKRARRGRRATRSTCRRCRRTWRF